MVPGLREAFEEIGIRISRLFCELQAFLIRNRVSALYVLKFVHGLMEGSEIPVRERTESGERIPLRIFMDYGERKILERDGDFIGIDIVRPKPLFRFRMEIDARRALIVGVDFEFHFRIRRSKHGAFDRLRLFRDIDGVHIFSRPLYGCDIVCRLDSAGGEEQAKKEKKEFVHRKESTRASYRKKGGCKISCILQNTC